METFAENEMLLDNLRQAQARPLRKEVAGEHDGKKGTPWKER